MCVEVWSEFPVFVGVSIVPSVTPAPWSVSEATSRGPGPSARSDSGAGAGAECWYCQSRPRARVTQRSPVSCRLWRRQHLLVTRHELWGALSWEQSLMIMSPLSFRPALLCVACQGIYRSNDLMVPSHPQCHQYHVLQGSWWPPSDLRRPRCLHTPS